MYRVAPATLQTRVAELEYGRFTDGLHTFVVRQATSVPDTVRVHALDVAPCRYWVVVLTDVGTTKVDATWCGTWTKSNIAWRAQVFERTFALFFRDRPRLVNLTAARGNR